MEKEAIREELKKVKEEIKSLRKEFLKKKEEKEAHFKKGEDYSNQINKLYEEIKEIEKANNLDEFKVEPSKWELAEKILPIIVHMMFFDIMLEAKASEHSSRMIAMKNAKEAALKIAKKLTVQYNKARQAMITREVSEITAWVESMKDV